MLILGIDPSLRNTGLAILDTDSQQIIYKRTIKTSHDEPIEARLHHIHGHVMQVLHMHNIRHAAIETQYFRKYTAALKIAMAYAACLLACESLLVPIGHYNPKCIKKNFTGIGSADKSMMIAAVHLLHPNIGMIDSHIADAIALAHVHQQFLS